MPPPPSVPRALPCALRASAAGLLCFSGVRCTMVLNNKWIGPLHAARPAREVHVSSSQHCPRRPAICPRHRGGPRQAPRAGTRMCEQVPRSAEQTSGASDRGGRRPGRARQARRGNPAPVKRRRHNHALLQETWRVRPPAWKLTGWHSRDSINECISHGPAGKNRFYNDAYKIL